MTFKVGQKLVYPNHGVTVVENIAPGSIDGNEQTYYHLRLLSNNSKVMVPKGNLELVGLRPLCQTREVRAENAADSAASDDTNLDAHAVFRASSPV